MTRPGDGAGGDEWDRRVVRPDGREVRRRRHDRGWSPRQLVAAIRRASEAASGLPSTLTPNELQGIEEEDEPIPYSTLCLLAAGLECDPVDLQQP